MADMIRLALPKGRMQDGVFRLLGDAGVQVELDEALRGVTPGQGAVFYDGDLCLGGGIIV